MELTIQNLCKTYANGIQALKDVSLNISTGLFGLLGPNGAGKTTLMRTIATLQEADEGKIHFDGVDVLAEKQKVKERLGYLPQEFDFYPKETAQGLLEYFALLKGIPRKGRSFVVEDLLKRIHLWDERKQRLGTFSGGMKQRFGIAQALLGDPRLIIVDEPTAGLDPAERNRFHNLLSEIGEDVVVILSTHIVEDVSQVCTRMAVIDDGCIIHEGGTLDTIESLRGRVWEKEIPKPELIEYSEKYRILSSRLFAGKTYIRIFSETHPQEGFIPSEVRLEDAYFYFLSMN